MPYTIVLTPSIEQAMKYVEVSQSLYSDYQPNYLLANDGTSSPHIKVHYAALEVLAQFGLQPLNACDNDYRPHLTLARISMPEQMKTWPKNLCENPGNFKLEFGLSDEKWQYAQTLASFP